MSGISPKTIITGQDVSISNAVAKVFPKVNHHYCMWHIEKKVPEYLNRVYHEHGEFKYQFYNCIHQSTTVEEFDSDWEAMIDKYGLQDNQWLNKIFSIREKWIPAYVRHNFCAGMSTTQRSESILCRHVLCVFIKKKVYCFPKQYVLHRWSINAKKEKVKEVTIEGFQEGSNNASDTSLFNSIMVHSLELSERGSQSEKHHDIAIQSLQNGIAKLDLLNIEESSKKFVDSTSEDMPKVSDVNIALHDPPLIETKGHPRTLRMKSSLEMVRKGSSTCSYCMKRGHTKPKCPNLNQTR
ncbi:hypothetical protein KIW84_044377 [Lathyrus oleraceus]|uniref:Protein FAR1-RELATED SEQUENCE n=1 Tax=Pisum sativum TaxID=3888 RepID=A0A9D4XGF4_PEA|nr:hypothetical protein KIW84_044377 [Pisum sativum]